MEKIKCCHVCPEQFYVPEDYNDPIESRQGNAALLEIFKKSNSVFQTSTNGRRKRRHRRRLQQSVENEPESQKSRKGGDLYWAFHDFYDRQPYTESLKDEKNDFSNNDPNRDTVPAAPQPKSENGACCNICPIEEPAPPTLSGFKAKDEAGEKPSFLETMQVPRPNVMGSGTTCCPTCPTLEHLVHGPMEPLGGPFQLGKGKLGGDAGTVQIEPLAPTNKKGEGE